MPAITAESFPRRSPVYRELPQVDVVQVAGAAQLGHSAAAGSSETRLFDLSLMPRFGLRGEGAADWLRQNGYLSPEHINRAQPSADGACVARLGKTEYWVLKFCAQPQAPADVPHFTAAQSGCYPVYCAEGRAWFALAGRDRAELMAKLCAVDLRESAFPELAIAQTSVARVNVVIMHHCIGDTRLFSIFVDTAAAQYLWGVLLDAMAEFNGGIGGVLDLA